MTVLRDEMLKTNGTTDKFTEDEINAIWEKEFIYNFGIIILETLNNEWDPLIHIKKIYEEDGIRFTATVSASAGLDSVITTIINDCLKSLPDRPDFPEVVKRLREWGAMEYNECDK